MHNAAFRALGLDFRYELRSLKPEDLEAFVADDLKDPVVQGANVTIPYKISIIKYLDELDVIAQRCGSVNTIVNDGSLLKGYNTDGSGAIRAIKEAYGNLNGINVVVIGAGGTARSICYHLSLVVKKLVVFNRMLQNATELIETISRYPEHKATLFAQPLNNDFLRNALEHANLVVNTTPIGMSPKTEYTPIHSDMLRPGLLVFDVVYNPPKTRLLREAEAAGAETLTGVNMLVYQGAEAFKIWTGLDAPDVLMKRAVEEALGAK